jgi:hypothetical protein
MSTRDRYIKIIESLVNGEEAKASDLLHEAFVDKAREIWNDLVEADESIEDELAEEELEEAIGSEEADDFIDDIEVDEDEIESEEMYGEAEEDDMDDYEAADELAGDEGDMDFEVDGDMGDMGGEEGGVEDAMMSVEDALADLKAEFARLMGDMGGDEEAEEMGDEEGEEMDMDMDMEEPEVEEELAFEAAELSKIGKEKAIHPVAMPDATNGKAGPVGPGTADPFAHNKANGKARTAVNMSAKGSAGSAKGLSDTKAKDMGVTHPGHGASLKPENRGHGAEKKGKN